MKSFFYKLTNLSVLWFVIPMFILVMIPTFISTKPILNLTDDDITIYKFAITILGVTVGIGTVINSTRSARIASESIKLTREKELREQSSHPIILSFIESFPYRAPIYKNSKDFNPNLPKLKDSQNGKTNSSKRSINKKNTTQDLFLDELAKGFIDPLVHEDHLEVINTGKGSCVNLEYEFEFLNKELFEEYIFNNSLEIIEIRNDLPTYELIIKNTNHFLEMKITDYNITPLIDSIDIKQILKSQAIEKKFKFPKKNMFKNYKYLGSGEKISLPLPHDFLILSKHYAIIEILKENINNNAYNDKIPSSIKNMIHSNMIKPIGIINLSFYDESLIRTGEYSSNEKSKITYSIMINENTTIFKGHRFGMHLESTLLNFETLPNKK